MSVNQSSQGNHGVPADLPFGALAGTHWIESLSDGTRVLIRPLREEDREREQTFIERLSPESRRFRFMDTFKNASPGRLEQLRLGALPISEPGLDELVAEMVATGRLTFSSDPADLRDARLTIVCVGTLDADGEWSADTVRRAVRALAEDRSGPRQIVVRSTLPLGAAGAAA